MNPKYTHDFSSASIKHLIEAEFYQKAGENLPKTSITSTIVTGPDYQRHIDNHNKYIKRNSIRICEINLDIFIDIYKGCKDLDNVKVVNKSVELFGSTFIDCDLTCVSDLDVIKATLLKQIDVQCQNFNKKVFIFSFSLRAASKAKSIMCYLRPIFGLLGANIQYTVMKRAELSQITAKNNWINQYTIAGGKGRIKDYVCYEYNAGGGPMLTCLLIYK